MDKAKKRGKYEWIEVKARKNQKPLTERQALNVKPKGGWVYAEKHYPLRLWDLGTLVKIDGIVYEYRKTGPGYSRLRRNNH